VWGGTGRGQNVARRGCAALLRWGLDVRGHSPQPAGACGARLGGRRRAAPGPRLCALLWRWLGCYALQQSESDDLVQDDLAVVVRELPAFCHSGQQGAFRNEPRPSGNARLGRKSCSPLYFTIRPCIGSGGRDNGSGSSGPSPSWRKNAPAARVNPSFPPS